MSIDERQCNKNHDIDMNENLANSFSIIIVALMGVLVGSLFMNVSWREDCIKQGDHQHGGKIYECKMKETK